MTEIVSPFAQFFDVSGAPLNNGAIYIGTGSLDAQSNPIPVYWDNALTIPALQPIRTLNGYIVRNGTPARIFCNADNFSMTVKTNTGRAVWSIQDATSDKSLLEILSQPDGASLIGFTQANTGTPARTVQDKLRDIVFLKDFGAVGDGVTDDAAAVLTALNSGAKVIDGQGLTYKINSPLSITADNLTVQNATFDISSVPNQPGDDFIIRFEGTQGAFVNLTANLNANDNVISVGSTSGFSADQYVWVQSSQFFWASQQVGQYGKIKSIDSATQMTLYDNVLYDFTTANTARVAPIQTKNGIVLNKVQFIGAQANNQAALYFSLCSDVHVQDCTFLNVDYACVYVSRCVNVVVDSVQCRYSRAAAGLSYGVLFLNGTYNGVVVNGYSEDQRHYVATGSATALGGVNLYITVANNHITAARNAGIDAHPTLDYYTVNGNTIEQAADATGTTDGIICQGLNCVITNNTIVNATRHAIFHQLFPTIGSGSCIISNNLIRKSGGGASTDTGINVTNETTGAATLDGVNIVGNTIDGTNDFSMTITAVTGNINNVAITGNIVRTNATDSSCRLRAQGAGTSINDISITGNIFKSSGTQNLYLLGSASSSLNRVTISGNNIIGGTNGIRLSYAQNVVETGNYNTGVTRKVFVDTGASIIWLDRRQSSIVTMTNTTYVVLDQDEQLIANRASTITVTLPTAASWPGRVLRFKTIQAQAVDSNASNVVPIGDSAAGTSILPATDGAWAWLQSDGTNWVITARG
jgi:hypothetical protein